MTEFELDEIVGKVEAKLARPTTFMGLTKPVWFFVVAALGGVVALGFISGVFGA